MRTTPEERLESRAGWLAPGCGSSREGLGVDQDRRRRLRNPKARQQSVTRTAARGLSPRGVQTIFDPHGLHPRPGAPKPEGAAAPGPQGHRRRADSARRPSRCALRGRDRRNHHHVAGRAAILGENRGENNERVTLATLGCSHGRAVGRRLTSMKSAGLTRLLINSTLSSPNWTWNGNVGQLRAVPRA
jgi:hypothetical protein